MLTARLPALKKSWSLGFLDLLTGLVMVAWQVWAPCSLCCTAPFFVEAQKPQEPKAPADAGVRLLQGCNLQSMSIEHTRVFSWPIGRQIDPILSKRRLLHPLSAGCSRPRAPQRASAYWRHLRTAWRKRIKGDHEMICLAKCRSPGTTLFQRR